MLYPVFMGIPDFAFFSFSDRRWSLQLEGQQPGGGLRYLQRAPRHSRPKPRASGSCGFWWRVLVGGRRRRGAEFWLSCPKLEESRRRLACLLLAQGVSENGCAYIYRFFSTRSMSRACILHSSIPNTPWGPFFWVWGG